MASPKEIDGVLAILSAAYPMFQIPDNTIELYSKELSDVPAKELIQAAVKHIKRSRFFPTIAEIRGRFDEDQVRVRAEEGGREWKERLEEYRREALPRCEAAKFLKAINDKAGVALTPSRRSGMFSLIKQQPKQELGAELSEEQWDERKRKLKESAGVG